MGKTKLDSPSLLKRYTASIEWRRDNVKRGTVEIPKEIKIAGKTYSVEVKDLLKSAGVTNAGKSYSYSQKIWIDTSAHPEQQEETLLHEIIEMLNDTYDMDLDHQDISTISAGLYQIIKDNKLRF